MLRKYWFLIGALVLAGLIALAVFSFRDEFAYAQIATGYAAKQTCSCVHVSGRPLEACMADYPEEAGQISISQRGEIVRASVLFGAVSAEAAYEEGYGCALID